MVKTLLLTFGALFLAVHFSMSLGVIDRSVSHQLQKRFKELQKEFLAKQTDATEQRQIGQAMDKLFDRLFFLPKRRKRKHEEVTSKWLIATHVADTQNWNQ